MKNELTLPQRAAVALGTAIEEQHRAAKAESYRLAAEHAQKMAEQQAAMDARQRDLDHAEGLMLNAMYDQLAAAQQLEKETAEIAMADVVETVVAVVVEAPQRPSNAELTSAIAKSFDVDFQIAFEWLSGFGSPEF